MTVTIEQVGGVNLLIFLAMFAGAFLYRGVIRGEWAKVASITWYTGNVAFWSWFILSRQ